MKKIIIFIFIIVAIVAFYVSTPNEALSLMTDSQKSTLSTLRSYNVNTTPQEISDTFGKPIKSSAGGVTISWEIMQESHVTRVKAYFIAVVLKKIQFISLEPFWGYTLYYSKEGVSNEA